MSKKRILVFIGGYLPAKKYGGPVTSISNLVDNLSDDFDFYIVSNNHDLDETTLLEGIREGWNDVGQAKVCYISEKLYTKTFFESVIREVNPNVIYLSSIFYYAMNFPAIKAAKKCNVPVILAPRGELCSNALGINRTKKEIFILFAKIFGFFKNVTFHTTSVEEYEATINIFKCDKNKVFLMPNMHCKLTDWSEKNKVSGYSKMVFISRIHCKKNLLFALKRLKNVKERVDFDIFGPIEQSEYWDECKKVIESAPSNISIKYCGALEPGMSKEIFKNYDCFLFPTISENFGHVVSEAISSGCHVIISKGVTPWDDIHYNGGYAVDLEDTIGWENVISEICLMNKKDMDKFDKDLLVYIEDKLQTEKLKKLYINMFMSFSQK